MNKLISFVLAVLVISVGNCQTSLSKDTVSKLLLRSPAFSIYKDNYFIVGTTVKEKPSRYNSDAKFQISFKYRVANKPLFLGFIPYVAYSQKSFWNIFVNSGPFADVNFNPGLFFLRPNFRNGKYSGTFALSFEHQSNGRDSVQSRSWNFLAATWRKILPRNVVASVKLWLPLATAENPDLVNYIGYGEASLNWIIIQNKFTADMIIRKGASWDWKGSIEMNVAYRPFRHINLFVMLQSFNGYAESLLDYKQKVNMLRLGAALKPAYYRFY